MPTTLCQLCSGLFILFFALIGSADPLFAQVDRPRFLILLDNSASMAQNLVGVKVHGDGSEAHPGCDLNGTSTQGWKYDDSKLFQAKQAIIDTISAFGSAEFALATYSRILLGQRCTTATECPMGSSCLDLPGDAATDQFCAYSAGDLYQECLTGTGCTNCSNPSDNDSLLFDMRSFDCETFRCSFANGCVGGQVLVGFPNTGQSNALELYQWIDGKEDRPPFALTSNREIRATTLTPIASAIDSVRTWLLDGSRSDIGAGAGLLAKTGPTRDTRSACRPYSIILITDGEDTCSPNAKSDPILAANATYLAGIQVYVVGFGTGYSLDLNNMAMAGSGQKKLAYFPTNQSELTATLGDIILNTIPITRCHCEASCATENNAFEDRGKPCTVGVGRCKRQGAKTCNAAGDGLICAAEGVCGVDALAPGTPLPEQCGTLAGCLAPTAADCADENCDGSIDENLSCDCAAQVETCNGLDDNCDGIIDNVAEVSCGLKLGACQSGKLKCEKDSSGGQQLRCIGLVAPSPELCDGIDNDCDGVVDAFERPCFDDTQKGCQFDVAQQKWSCVGACKTGTQRCIQGAWKACVGATIPVPEISCDTLDNNCDGTIDETGPSGVCYPKATLGCDLTTGLCVGECRLGTLRCHNNRIGTTCYQAVLPVEEKCNQKDDDCDGKIDEDFVNLGKPCNEKSCQGAGELVCNASGMDVECSVKAEGPSPEICDGRDNDCDGQIDEIPGIGEAAIPGVGLSCGSNVGECQSGTSACVDGKIACSGKSPTPEICDGKDNDCNGITDDNVVAPAVSCNPEGIMSGASMIGECRAGKFQCKGVEGWTCMGGIGPKLETCDGRDNNCDGLIDNEAVCQTGFVCIEGECVARCTEVGENYPCTFDRVCKDGACRMKECVLRPCEAGFICQKDGTCVDRCAGVICPEGAHCVSGVCVDCYRTGCPESERCVLRRCVSDPCAHVLCAENELCQEGVCRKSCALSQCAAGEICNHGVCSPSSCANSCGSDWFCSEIAKSCQLRRCAGIACPSGLVCLESTGQCVADGCEQIRCPAGQTCRMREEGEPDCFLPAAKPSITLKSRGKGGGLLSCGLLPGPSDSDGSLPLATLMGMIWILMLIRPKRAGETRQIPRR